jgi:hypothetical protein
MFGYMGRNVLTSPGRNDRDLVLFKDYGFRCHPHEDGVERCPGTGFPEHGGAVQPDSPPLTLALLGYFQDPLEGDVG